MGYLETGVVQCADNLQALGQLPDECVDLVYLDPPFFSNRNYEVIWGDEAEVRSFADRWEGGINVYIEWMEARVRHLHRVLRTTGSLYLHCDPHASHYLKVMCDSIFGQSRFRSEVIWKRTTAHNSAKRYGPVHDVILFYSKGSEYVWNPSFQAYDPRYVATKYRHKDAKGNLYRLSDLTGPGRRKGPSGDEWRGYNPTESGRHWQPPSYCYDKYRDLTGEELSQFPLIQRLDKLDDVGLIQWPEKPGGRPEHRRYLADMPGVALQDVWTDLDPINARARERLGYPTQKPEALLERIIRSSSRPGDIVLDPFCGCGTAVAVAEKQQRQWLGFDISSQAVEIIKLRLNKLGAKPRIIGLPTSVDDLRHLGPFEFQHWIVQRVMGTPSPRNVADMGIDGYSFFEQLPIQVKQSERVGRAVVDEFETAVARTGKHLGYVVAFSFTRGAYEEAARAKREGRPEIVLVKVDDVVRVGDLIDSADREGRTPDLSRVTPDLIGLFNALQTQAADRPFTPAPPPEAKPSAQELIASARRRRGQGQLTTA